MTTKYRVFQPYGQFIVIEGETMVKAIESNFKMLARLAGIGNVAGYSLRDVRLLPPDPQTTRGYKHFARLQITASGMPTVSGDTTPNDRVTEIDIICPVGAFTEPHVFEILPRPA